MINETNNGYTFEIINFEKGIFDESIDATYIIHLKGNGRLESIKKQLNKFKPTKVCYILFNDGYKNSNKKNYIDTPDKDLRDCNFTIFNDAIQKNYNNILIHEDDFFYDDKILLDEHKNNLNNFMLENINEEFIYYLGCTPVILNRINKNHNKLILGYEAHAIIYSRSIMNKILKLNIEKIEYLYDNFLCMDHLFLNKKYTYKIPLCFQLHYLTENSKDWLSLNILLDKNEISKNIFLNFINNIYYETNKTIMIDILKLNKEENLKIFVENLYKILPF